MITQNLGNVFKWTSIFPVVIYTSLGLAFTIIGLLTIKMIRKHLKPFYEDYKCYLWISVIGLSVPLILKGVFLFLKSEFNWLHTHFYWTMLTLYILKVLLALGQMTSLIFGFLRLKYSPTKTNS